MMESLCGVHQGLLRRPLVPFLSRSPPPLSARPLLALRAPRGRRRLSIRASSAAPRITSGDSSGETWDVALGGAISSMVKPACIALVAGAALFLSRVHKPSVALAVVAPAQPPAQSEHLPSPSPDVGDPETLSEEEKVKFLEDFLDSHPDDIKALRSLMELKIKTHKLPEAIAIVDRLIILEPGEKDLPLLKAHLQSYDGETETAKQGFEDMLRRDPMHVEAYHGLVMAAWQSEAEGDLGGVLKRIEGAMELCKKEKRNGDLRDFKLLVAQVKVLEGNYQEALKVYQDLVKEEPRDFRPYLCQGIVYSLLHKKDEAEKQFHKYRQLVPKEHPYAQYFDENMVAMKVFSQIDENRRASPLDK